ncbi:glutamate ABC transporter substrate-binding protein [Corynebacterium mendelii]|uniref:Glutamate ABC transporter substrate-binding protein n=1 Tax=Corynebacterium mendelii TaxID=2765362 RepID=A0A939E1A6_9CORY|nr:glutamate ABC transporter substrate-binding protein [Corynebacterium mendelii]MBN9645145.1 glutamate ABC transporter substrate-binding protein [Corynebacterium mendelii]
MDHRFPPAAARRLAAAVCALALAASACGCHRATGTDPLPQWTAPAATGSVPLPPGAHFEPASGHPSPMPEALGPGSGSAALDGRSPAERVPHIFARGRLIVGVDQSQHLLSFRDPSTGQLAGFEIDVAEAIAEDIFGEPGHIEFRFVDSTDRVAALKEGRVDIVVRTMTVTPQREQEVLFSTPYFMARTRLLSVEKNHITTIDDLTGKTVCVAEGSTSLQLARAVAYNSRILKVKNWADCLVALQQAQADAVMTDDTVLSGIAAQDPYTKITGPTLADGYYAVAVAPPTRLVDTVGVIMQVNSTIERIRSDGTWWQMFNRWLAPYQQTVGPPPLNYRHPAPGKTQPTGGDRR